MSMAHTALCEINLFFIVMMCDITSFYILLRYDNDMYTAAWKYPKYPKYLNLKYLICSNIYVLLIILDKLLILLMFYILLSHLAFDFQKLIG